MATCHTRAPRGTPLRGQRDRGADTSVIRLWPTPMTHSRPWFLWQAGLITKLISRNAEINRRVKTGDTFGELLPDCWKESPPDLPAFPPPKFYVSPPSLPTPPPPPPTPMHSHAARRPWCNAVCPCTMEALDASSD